jgi:hypothetical protein
MTRLIEWREVESSNVLLIGWTRKPDEDAGMFVKFRSGSLYFYHGVSRQRAVACANAPSVGHYLNSKIKGHYDSERIDDQWN